MHPKHLSVLVVAGFIYLALFQYNSKKSEDT